MKICALYYAAGFAVLRRGRLEQPAWFADFAHYGGEARIEAHRCCSEFAYEFGGEVVPVRRP
mgnify:CR=1 FL=1